MPSRQRDLDFHDGIHLGGCMFIRAATAEDLDAIAAIYNDEVLCGTSTFDTEPRDHAAQHRWFASHDRARHPVLVALDPAAVVLGWASLSPWSDRGAYARTVEASVFVHAKHRRKGVGRFLLQGLLEEARRAGHRVVLGRIEAGNEASRHLLEVLGFSSVGVMHAVGEKFDRALDVEIFEYVVAP